MAAFPHQSETAKGATQSTTPKQIHSLVLDTGPLIKNDPPVSVLLSRAEQLYVLPSVLPEIRDHVTRTRVETTLLPFVIQRTPKPESIKLIQDFARKTGDLAVLSKADVFVLALTYDLECERNNGDWRLRNSPGQKRLNGKPPQPQEQTTTETQNSPIEETTDPKPEDVPAQDSSIEDTLSSLELNDNTTNPIAVPEDQADPELEASIPSATDDTDSRPRSGEKEDEAVEEMIQDSESDGEGWITPSNLKSQQAKDAGATGPSQPLQRTLQAAMLTSDFAMQNVALRINLNLIAPSLSRITHLKTWILRCYGCFTTTKDMDKQFCPSCGQPTLLRTSCSTDEHGNFKIHLKKNFQWNTRGNVYSVPKPVHGSSHGRLVKGVGGGKKGWGRDLILAEDQKEYVKAKEEQGRARKKDLMDEDYLPGILSGDRGGQGDRIRVGPGRGVNSKRRS